MDATEVTSGQYGAFQAAKGADTSGQDAWCAWNTTYTPVCSAAGSNHPVACVDWCDAYAYCRWAGKHLCGKIGGGPNAYGDYANASSSEWYNACTAGGTRTYPYGSTYDGTACVGRDYDGTPGYQSGIDVARPVGSATRCRGTASPFEGIHDLSGNVWEWEDSCNGTTGTNDACRLRGGSFYDAGAGLSCGAGDGLGRDAGGGDGVGFRCCGASF